MNESPFARWQRTGDERDRRKASIGDDYKIVDAVATGLEHLRRQWIGADSGPMLTYHEAAEEIVCMVQRLSSRGTIRP